MQKLTSKTQKRIKLIGITAAILCALLLASCDMFSPATQEADPAGTQGDAPVFTIEEDSQPPLRQRPDESDFEEMTGDTTEQTDDSVRQKPSVGAAGDIYNPNSAQILIDFAQITPDMSLEDVNRLVGRAGENVFADFYEWEYPNGYYLEVDWYEGEMNTKQVNYPYDDRSVFEDGSIDFSGARALFERVDNGERVSYDEFKQTLGTPGILYKVSYFDFEVIGMYYYWMSASGNDVVSAGFDRGICSYLFVR